MLGAAAASFLGFFVFLFIPIDLDRYLRMETYFPWTAVGLGALWYFVVAPRQLAPLTVALRRASAGATLAADELHRAIRTAHRLPQLLALSKLGFFAAGGALLAVEGVTLFNSGN